MRDFLQSTALVLLLALLYAYLFYHLELGLNILAFDAICLLLLYRRRPELASQVSFRWAVAGCLAAALSVVIVHSSASFLAHHLSFLLVIGFAQVRELRFIWFGLLLGLTSLLEGPIRWFWAGSRVIHWRFVPRDWLRQGVVPLVVAAPFFVLYLSASDKFAGGIQWVFSGILFSETVSRFYFLAIAGILICGPLFFPAGTSRLATLAAGFSDHLSRRSRPNRKTVTRPKRTSRKFFGLIGLRREYRRGVLTLGLLNLLIACVNLLDLRYLWMDAGRLTAAELSQYVHAGTYNLIFSIVLAMAVVLYLFRGNLNFYTEAEHLKPLTFCWLGQNALLTVSVGIRNWHYIAEYGLALGRIQVAFVLLLILVGLFTLFRKVRDRLSFTYLLQANGLAVWLFLIAFGAVNWTCVITRVNLRQPTAQIDWKYLVDELDDRNTFLLWREVERIPPEVLDTYQWGERERGEAFQARDWRGWNYADWRTGR